MDDNSSRRRKKRLFDHFYKKMDHSSSTHLNIPQRQSSFNDDQEKKNCARSESRIHNRNTSRIYGLPNLRPKIEHLSPCMWMFYFLYAKNGPGEWFATQPDEDEEEEDSQRQVFGKRKVSVEAIIDWMRGLKKISSTNYAGVWPKIINIQWKRDRKKAKLWIQKAKIGSKNILDHCVKDASMECGGHFNEGLFHLIEKSKCPSYVLNLGIENWNEEQQKSILNIKILLTSVWIEFCDKVLPLYGVVDFRPQSSEMMEYCPLLFSDKEEGENHIRSKSNYFFRKKLPMTHLKKRKIAMTTNLKKRKRNESHLGGGGDEKKKRKLSTTLIDLCFTEPINAISAKEELRKYFSSEMKKL